MGQHKFEGNSALALAEECAEVIQVITKKVRFDGSWSEVPPGKTKSRWQELNDEMEDLQFQWQRLQADMLVELQQEAEADASIAHIQQAYVFE